MFGQRWSVDQRFISDLAKPVAGNRVKPIRPRLSRMVWPSLRLHRGQAGAGSVANAITTVSNAPGGPAIGGRPSAREARSSETGRVRGTKAAGWPAAFMAWAIELKKHRSRAFVYFVRFARN